MLATLRIDTIGETRLFSVHMAQHLLIGDLAPLLLVLGLSGPLLRPLLARPALRPARRLTHPLVALPLWALNHIHLLPPSSPFNFKRAGISADIVKGDSYKVSLTGSCAVFGPFECSGTFSVSGRF